MLRVLLCIVLSVFGKSIYSQTDKSNFLFGGNIAGSFHQGSTTKAVGFNGGASHLDLSFQPSFGYFLVKNFTLGLKTPISFNIYFYPYDKTYTDVQMGISPFARKYFSISERLSPFLQASIGYAYTPFTISQTNFQEVHTFNGSLGLGITYFVSNTLGIEVLLVYDYQRSDVPPSNYVNKGYGINSINLAIGITGYFPPKEK